MISRDFKEANRTFVAPEGMTKEECRDLPAHQFEIDGQVNIFTCWNLSIQELAEVQRTGCIWLRIVGGQPPVSLQTNNPFKKVEPPKPGAGKIITHI